MTYEVVAQVQFFFEADSKDEAIGMAEDEVSLTEAEGCSIRYAVPMEDEDEDETT